VSSVSWAQIPSDARRDLRQLGAIKRYMNGGATSMVIIESGLSSEGRPLV
jgi:hypothetical protein